MGLILLIFIFIFGVFVGSFLNVLVDRLPIGENPFLGRSHCDKCRKSLEARDMVPLFSYIVLHGKCRFCSHKLGLYYPLVELVTGSLFAYAAYYVLTSNTLAASGNLVSSSLSIVLYLIVMSVLIVVFFTDLKFGLIPFKTVVLGTCALFFLHILFPIAHISMFNYALSAMGAFLFFLSLFLITKGRGMGFGDVVYAFFMGFMLGFPKTLLGLYFAFISGAIISLILIVLKKKKMKGGSIPFGPFLVVGTVAALFWGDFLLSKIIPYLLGA